MLQPLPEQPYELASWKRMRLHRDCHVVFENAFYSAPFRYVGQQLLVRGSSRSVKLYTEDYQLVATHNRAQYPGERLMVLDHFPPYKVEGLTWSVDVALVRAADLGAAVLQTVQHLLSDRVVDPLPKVRRLLALADRYGAADLEAACARALAHDDPSYITVKRILKHNLQDHTDLAPAYVPLPADTFARSVDELVGTLWQEVAGWQ
jgi:hypothetical protein